MAADRGPKTSKSVTRIHYEIPTELHRLAKAEAALQGLTLKDFVIDVLTKAVGAQPRPVGTKRASDRRRTS